MNYIDEIFLRADIRHIREFLLLGASDKTDTRPYIERINAADAQLREQLSKRYPDEEEYEKAAEAAYIYGAVMQDVYMEIGLQAGAMIAGQVWQNRQTAMERLRDAM